MSKIRFSIVLASLLLVWQTAGADVIFLKSGNGIVGGTDSAINMLVGPVNSPFPAALTPGQFASARTGPPAFIINRHPLWKAHLTSNPSAEWISTNAAGNSSGNTALYAMDFVTAEPSIGFAALDIDFLVDNGLGDVINEGLFINGQPVLGSKLFGNVTAHFQVDQPFPTFDITSLVNPGMNTLYINASDGGGPSGLQFSATVTVRSGVPEPPPNGVPEPTTLLLLSLGLAGLGRLH